MKWLWCSGGEWEWKWAHRTRKTRWKINETGFHVISIPISFWPPCLVNHCQMNAWKQSILKKHLLLIDFTRLQCMHNGKWCASGVSLRKSVSFSEKFRVQLHLFLHIFDYLFNGEIIFGAHGTNSLGLCVCVCVCMQCERQRQWLVAIYPCHVSITSSKIHCLSFLFDENATYEICAVRARTVLFLRCWWLRCRPVCPIESNRIDVLCWMSKDVATHQK